MTKENSILLSAYSEQNKDEWDNIVEQADNSHFMINRNYMDYHSDRFRDASFLVSKNNQTIGVIPGNLENNNWHSHQGLTFGGLLLLPKHNRTNTYCEVFSCLFDRLKQQNIKNCIIKPLPYIYHYNPCEADLYALNQCNISKWNVEVTSTIDLSIKTKLSQIRTRGIKRAKKANIQIERSFDYEEFWKILATGLQEKYNVNPVHSANEISLLQSRFPDNIKLYTAVHPQEGICGGTVVFETKTVAHAQYISANQSGKDVNALDLVFTYLVDHYRDKKRYFDFGISTENSGTILNNSLIQFKEGFGGRSVAHNKLFFTLK